MTRLRESPPLGHSVVKRASVTVRLPPFASAATSTTYFTPLRAKPSGTCTEVALPGRSMVNLGRAGSRARASPGRRLVGLLRVGGSGRGLGVGDKLSEDGVGNPAFEAAHGFHPGLALGELASAAG